MENVAEKIEEMKITTDIGGWPTCSGAHVSLFLIPAEERDDGIPHVYTFGHVGSGQPMHAFNRRHYGLGTVDVSTDADSLDEWLHEHADQLVELSDKYLGAEWDGSNHVGQWEEDHLETAQELSDDLEQAANYGDIASKSDPAEYLFPIEHELLESLGSHSVERVASDLIDDAADDGVLLDSDDTEDYLRSLIEDKVLIETMPDHLRAAHRAAGNWGVYPHNGAQRRYVDEDEAEEIVAADTDGDNYDHIVEAELDA